LEVSFLKAAALQLEPDALQTLDSLLMQNFPLKIEVVNTFWIYFSLLGSMFETHTAELVPSVSKFAEMEFKDQTSSFSLQNRNWMRTA